MVRQFLVAVGATALLVGAGCGAEPAETGAAPGASKSSTATKTPSSTPSSSPSDSPSDTPTEDAKTSGSTPETLKFAATTLDGDKFDGASLAGKPAALWFWAPWCPVCKAAAGDVKSLAGQYDGEVTVVGVGGMDEVEPMRTFVSDHDLAGIPHLADAAGTVWKKFGVTYQHTWVIIDADGEVVDKGDMDEAEVDDRLAELSG